MSEEELKKEALELDQQIHKLEDKKMEITENVLTEKMNKKKSKEDEQEPVLVQIPSITTKSFEIIGKHLCSLSSDVTVLEFQASHEAGNTDELVIDKDYGITLTTKSNKDLTIEYIRKRSSTKTTKIENPFNLDMYNRIMKYIDQYLGKFEDYNKKEHTQDLSVESFKLRVINKEMQDIAGTETDDFLLFFETTKYENEKSKEQLIEAHIRNNKEYIFESGFKHTSLNLVQLIEANKYYKKKSNKRESIIFWEGYHKKYSPYHLAPIANNDVAWYLRYNSGYFPDDFIKLKRFYITEANIIKMIDGGI